MRAGSKSHFPAWLSLRNTSRRKTLPPLEPGGSLVGLRVPVLVTAVSPGLGTSSRNGHSPRDSQRIPQDPAGFPQQGSSRIPTASLPGALLCHSLGSLGLGGHLGCAGPSELTQEGSELGSSILRPSSLSFCHIPYLSVIFLPLWPYSLSFCSIPYLLGVVLIFWPHL